MTIGAAEQAENDEDSSIDPYAVLLPRQARRNLAEDLPVEVAIAATETIQQAIGTYRIIYRLDEAKRVVEVHSIRHRRDAYRA